MKTKFSIGDKVRVTPTGKVGTVVSISITECEELYTLFQENEKRFVKYFKEILEPKTYSQSFLRVGDHVTIRNSPSKNVWVVVAKYISPRLRTPYVVLERTLAIPEEACFLTNK